MTRTQFLRAIPAVAASVRPYDPGEGKVSEVFDTHLQLELEFAGVVAEDLEVASNSSAEALIVAISHRRRRRASPVEAGCAVVISATICQVLAWEHDFMYISPFPGRESIQAPFLGH
jgi:hypothetical protein